MYQSFFRKQRRRGDLRERNTNSLLYNPFIISLNHILNSTPVKYITQVSQIYIYISYTYHQTYVLKHAHINIYLKREKKNNDNML